MIVLVLFMVVSINITTSFNQRKDHLSSRTSLAWFLLCSTVGFDQLHFQLQPFLILSYSYQSK